MNKVCSNCLLQKPSLKSKDGFCLECKKKAKQEYDRQRYLSTRGKDRLRRHEWIKCVKEKSIKNNNLNKKENKITLEQIEQIEKLILNNISTRNVARQLNISRWAVQQICKKLKIDISNRKVTPKALPKFKTCKDCKKHKNIDQFRVRVKNKVGGIRVEPYCKKCELIRSNERIKKRAKLLRKTCPEYKIKKFISYNVWKSLKKFNCNKKNETCLKYLPYSLIELKSHLESKFESWMNWSNWGKYDSKKWDENDPSTWTWQIDHIIPQSILAYNNMEEKNFKICWDLKNLRPLSSKQNFLDGVNKTRHNLK